MNVDVQGMAKWIELHQTGNSCASVQSAFPAVVACYAVFLNLSCALDVTRQQQLTFNCMGNRLLGDLVSKETVCCIGGIHSDEGLTLETLVFESFTMANLLYRPCG